MITMYSTHCPKCNCEMIVSNDSKRGISVEDEVVEEVEPRAKIGDLYILGRWVYCKKCGKKHFIS